MAKVLSFMTFKEGLYEEREVRSKQHRVCGICTIMIPAGSTCTYVTSIHDRVVEHHHQHTKCPEFSTPDHDAEYYAHWDRLEAEML